MNRNNNAFNKNEVESKLKDFKEGTDYSISPTDEPNIETYNFYNDKLRSMFRGDKVPVRIVREAYDGKDYTYRGHFEEGKDYRYSAQYWDYSKGKNDYQETRSWNYPKPVESWVENELKRGGKGFNITSFGGKIGESGLTKEWEGEEHFHGGVEDKEKNILPGTPCATCGKRISQNQGHYICKEHKEHHCSRMCAEQWYKCHMEWVAGDENNNSSDLQKENHDLRQQLAEVKQQLAEVLEELKKLKSNINGKDNEKLNQQINYNEKLIKDSENTSLTEVKDQINKSQALMKEFNTGVSNSQDNKGNEKLPYVIGGSVVLTVAGIIGYFLVRKNKRK